MNQLNLNQKLKEGVAWLNFTLIFLQISFLLLNPNSVSTTYQCLVVINAIVHVGYLSKIDYCLRLICNNQLKMYLKRLSSIFTRSALWVCLVSNMTNLVLSGPVVVVVKWDAIYNISIILYIAICFYICAFTKDSPADITFFSLFLILMSPSSFFQVEQYIYSYIFLLFLLFATLNCLNSLNFF